MAEKIYKRKPLTDEHKKKLSENNGKHWLGKKRPDISKMITERNKSNPIRHWLGKKRPNVSGENNYNWKKDRSTLKIQNRRNDMGYKEWRKQVWTRDNFKCMIKNQDCVGRIEAHHILSWSEYAELRYEINNGITLCHAHHPRKRAKEKRLSPYFMELVKSKTS